MSRRYLRTATLLWGLYALMWLALEGSVGRDVILAGWGLAVAALWLSGQVLRGQTAPVRRLVALGVAAGLAWGAALAPAALGLMTFKTGLHAHGPEYTAAQIAWVWGQWPLWALGGGLAGAGLALLLAARRGR